MEVKQAVNYGLEKVRFLAPVRAGKRVRNHISVAAVEDKGNGRVLLTTENTIEIEGEDKPALVAFSHGHADELTPRGDTRRQDMTTEFRHRREAAPRSASETPPGDRAATPVAPQPRR